MYSVIMFFCHTGMGIVWGIVRHRMICEKHAVVRQHEHEVKVAKEKEERIKRKFEADRSLYDIYLVCSFI